MVRHAQELNAISTAVMPSIICLGYSVLDAGLSFGRRGLVYI